MKLQLSYRTSTYLDILIPDIDHLVSCLSSLYELKVHRDTPRNNYLDYSPSFPSPCMTLSMPHYIPSMLSHLCPSAIIMYVTGLNLKCIQVISATVSRTISN